MAEKKQLSAGVMLALLLLWPLVAAADQRDSDGRPLPERVFSRIISLYPAHTRNLADMGAADLVVGVGRGDQLLPDRPRLGYRDDPERFLALRPDLVLIRPMISRAHPALVRKMEENGVAVVSLQPTSVEGLFDYWRILGRLSGHPDGARAMVDRFSRGLEQMRARVGQIPAAQRKRVYFEAIHRRMKTFAPSSMAIFVLESAGGINVAADAVRVRATNIAAYGKERILARADRIDVFLAQHGRMNPVTIDTIRNEPGFSVIRAVRENRVFLVDEKLVSRPTLGLLEGMARVYDLLYGAGEKKP